MYAKILGLGAVTLLLSARYLHWLFRRWRSRVPLKEVLFFPTSVTCVEHLLLRHLLSATSSLDLCVFAFSNQELSRTVLLLRSRGVAVRILTDKNYMIMSGSQIGALRRAGTCVRHDLEAVHMHHKFAVVDGRLLITGSLNWTVTAIQSNRENILVTEEPDLVRPFIREFEQLWEANDPSRYRSSLS
ncbi:mitochondrial cardiolipin hydrolase-like [Scleropages formosus]|uniref:Mitochondrial cardiolipin hydrolase n=1 Tax=Scleropages formosus TaxID=113540 RepID=A0A0P7V331_SCLFO|nr:mitochondrial cardiolipin hydrolase-like [Scleropages formosus]